ncbi:MAG: glycosyltransferase family 4 protein [Candidatus Magasanikbacteria bacterium]|nr:glycosyltransferase family 4 protein [Candidatus Magasanikbacteria bacterium]
MKRLIVTLEYPPQIGGIAGYTYNLAKHLPAEETVVYALPDKQAKEFDAQNAWPTYRLRPYWSFIWPHWLRLFFQLSALVSAEKIDMLYVNHVLPVGYAAYLIKKFKKIPYTLFLHGTDIAMATSTPSKRKKFIQLCLSASAVVVNSEFLKNKLLSVVENLADVRVLYPCPSDNFFDQVKNQAQVDLLRSQLALSGKRVIITVARVAEGKGYPHLVRFMPEILNKVPNTVWLIVGDGPKMNEVMALVQKNNLQNVVRFLGSMAPAELPKYYHLADLFVLLTHKDDTHEEGWGTVFLEAAACGLPVVAGRVGGVEEAVLDGKTGMVVDIFQEKDAIESIVKLLMDKELAHTLGTAGQTRVRDSFRWNKEVLKLS